MGDGFPLTILDPFQAENQTWVNQFLGFCIRRNIFLDKMDIGISGRKNKNMSVGMLFYFIFSTFPKIIWQVCKSVYIKMLASEIKLGF